MRTPLKGIGQVILLLIISWVMNKLVAILHIPIPGSILGIILIFLLLQTKVIRLEWIELGANWLLAEMLLFFIPPAVGIMKYIPIFREYGIQLFIIVIVGTFIVMTGSGLLAAKIANRKERKML